jgi:hypothetical protein
MTVAELRRRMGSGEFRQWVAYSHIEPFGELRADARTWALIAHASNLMRDPQKSKAIDLKEILSYRRAPVSPAAQWAQVDMWARRRRLAVEKGYD